VFAVVGDDGRGMVWPTSMPDEIAAEVAREARRAGHGELEQDKRKKRRAKAGGRPAPLSRVSKPAASRRAAAMEERTSDVEARRSSRPSLGVIRGEGSSSSSSLQERGDRRRALPPYLRVVK
jgi:hypothetical protein